MEQLIWKIEITKKSTSFNHGHFLGNLFSFENESDLEIVYLMSPIRRTQFSCRLLPSCSKTWSVKSAVEF